MSEKTTTELTFSVLNGLKSFSERIEHEEADRLRNSEGSLSFGVQYLDEALGGIYKNDLIVIGSKTGTGKTQLSTLIAQANAKQGKRVHFLALEAEEFEIERRIKYRLIQDLFYSSQDRPKIHLNYMDWAYGRLHEELRPIESKIVQKNIYPTLKTFYRLGGEDFGKRDFERLFLAIKEETDLVIIDHLHYFDHDDENENRAVKSIVKAIRDCALISSKPVILISHIRKGDRKTKSMIPDIEDFHGSSDIGKIATKAFVIAPVPGAGNTGFHRQTFFRVGKCRVDGSRTGPVAVIGYNIRTQSYEREYFLGDLSIDGTRFDPYDFSSMPPWAKNAKPVKPSEDP